MYRIVILNSPWYRINKVPTLPKGALLDWYLVTVNGIWVKWTYGYVQETSLRWLEICDMVCTCKGMYMAGNNTPVGWEWCLVGTEVLNVCQENISTPPLAWYKPRQSHAFIFFMLNSYPTMWILQQKESSDQMQFCAFRDAAEMLFCMPWLWLLLLSSWLEAVCNYSINKAFRQLSKP